MINVGIIGCGFVGESLLRDLLFGLLRGKRTELNRFLGRSGIPMLARESVNDFLGK